MKRFIFIVLIGTLLFVSCQREDEPEMVEISENELYVYLTNSDKNDLVEYCIEVDKTDLGKQITSVINVLKNGSEDTELEPTIPDNLLVEAVNLEGTKVIVHIAEGIEGMEQIDFILCRSSLIRSLTSIDGVDSIEFYVEGFPMKDDNGKVYGPFTNEDVVTTSSKVIDASEVQNLILYFSDNQGEKLIRVDRKVDLDRTESIEQRIILELMNPPDDDLVVGMIPEESEVKSIEVNDGVCYIDFNEAFKLKNYGGSASEIMTIYSIVNSLTELPNISRVQFMIEGEKTESLNGHLDFSALFEKNIGLISKEVQLND